MGFFTWQSSKSRPGELVAIPFRVGWGFSLLDWLYAGQVIKVSQSLSGWDGVFHLVGPGGLCRSHAVAIPFRVGWGFSPVSPYADLTQYIKVAIPFRVGWGFSLYPPVTFVAPGHFVAIPFRVGWGFSLRFGGMIHRRGR